MALILQNDQGTVVNANSYTDTSYADIYFSDRNNDTWANATTTQTTSALIKAWQYIDTMFKFAGYQATDTQNTEFPRYGIFNSRGQELTGIQTKVKNAQCEYALVALTQDLTINQTPINTPVIKKKSQKADVLATEVEYDTTIGQQIVFSYPNADFWLKEFLNGNRFNGYY
jgi:hypothetical protein